jgi:hypothetical protein
MLRAFLFVLSLLSDYREVSHALQTSTVWGVVNTSIFLGAFCCTYLRRLASRHSECDSLSSR